MTLGKCGATSIPAFCFPVGGLWGMGMMRGTDRIQNRHGCCCTIIRFRGLSKPFRKIMITTDIHANRLYITHL